MIKTALRTQPNGFCHNNYCMKELKGEYIYCYECNLEKYNEPKKQCSDCNKMVKLDYKKCYLCYMKKKK